MELNHCFPLPTAGQLERLPVIDRVVERNAILRACLRHRLPRDWKQQCFETLFPPREAA